MYARLLSNFGGLEVNRANLQGRLECLASIVMEQSLVEEHLLARLGFVFYNRMAGLACARTSTKS